MEAYKENFPKRNRIVSGISDLVLVIEAQYRSGTSITAQYAKDQRKNLCCLPSNIDSKCSLGTNKLIQKGAKLIIKPKEIIDILENKNQNLINKTQNEKVKIQKEYEEIYNIILSKPIHINDICKISKKNIQEVTTILTMLELEEYIEQIQANIFKIKEK